MRSTLALTETNVASRFATDSYVTVKIPAQASRQARVYIERGYLKFGCSVRDEAGNIIREERGGWFRDKDKGCMYVAFVLFGETDLLAFTGAESSTHVCGAGWSPEEALTNLRKEVRLVNAGSLSATWEAIAKDSL